MEAVRNVMAEAVQDPTPKAMVLVAPQGGSSLPALKRAQDDLDKCGHR
jgi:hypothetical protein